MKKKVCKSRSSPINFFHVRILRGREREKETKRGRVEVRDRETEREKIQTHKYDANTHMELNLPL
jgi:hypothetical protein